MNTEKQHRRLTRPIPPEVQKKILDRIHYVATHIEEFEEQLRKRRPKFKRDFPVMNFGEIAMVDPIPQTSKFKEIKFS